MLKVENLVVSYKQSQSLSFSTKRLVAVDGVHFSIPKGKILGLVGESGCGKSTIGRAILSLLPFDQGTISFEDQEIGKVSKEKQKLLKRKIQVVFQDPYSSLNPRFTIEEIVTEGLQIHFPNLSQKGKKRKGSQSFVRG